MWPCLDFSPLNKNTKGRAPRSFGPQHEPVSVLPTSIFHLSLSFLLAGNPKSASPTRKVEIPQFALRSGRWSLRREPRRRRCFPAAPPPPRPAEADRTAMERIHVAVRARPLTAEDAGSSPWRVSGNAIALSTQPSIRFEFGEELAPFRPVALLPASIPFGLRVRFSQIGYSARSAAPPTSTGPAPSTSSTPQ